MPEKNPAIDAYISKAQPFAKPILKRLRTIIHKACPKVTEEIKWGAPFYLYQDKVLCATMGFKAHCCFIFWKRALVTKKKGGNAKDVLKRLRRISFLKEIPSERELDSYIKIAMQFNEPGTKLPPREKASAPVKVPSDLNQALRANPKALSTFKSFSPTKKKDYIYWITGAKTEETRERRMEIAIDWMSEGKSRQWKYEAKKKAR